MIAPKPGTPEHARIVTASKVAAILGVSKWESPYSMWMKMAGRVQQEPTSTVQARGNYLEPAILAWWRDLHPEFGEAFRDQPYYALGDWAGATPDAEVYSHKSGEYALVDAKSAAYVDEWDNDGDEFTEGTSIDGVPIYYWVSSQWQMHVSGIHKVFIALIGPRLEFKEYVIEYDAAHCEAVETHCREFFDSLAADVPPPLDGTTATYDVARKQYDGLDKGDTVEIAPEVAIEYIDAANDGKDAVARELLAKSTLLGLMGDAQYAKSNGVRVARRQKSGAGFALYKVAKTSDAITTTETSAA